MHGRMHTPQHAPQAFKYETDGVQRPVQSKYLEGESRNVHCDYSVSCMRYRQ